MQKENVRDVKLDIIRIFSLFCVISVHFFLNTGFYDANITGNKMLLMVCIRNFFMICVPMFIILTGYLMNTKKISVKYYKGILKVIVTYILFLIIYIIFRKLYLGDNVGIFDLISNILSYIGLPNAWYVEMYIGLFMLIPFLNLICNNLENKKQFRLLLITLFLLVSVPGILNIYKFNDINWWIKPSLSDSYLKIFPSWWSAIYPILYYFLGAYIYKYKKEIKLKISHSIFLLILVVIINGLFSVV